MKDFFDRTLLRLNAAFNPYFDIDQVEDEDGNTSLMLACLENDTAKVHALIQAGANVNITNEIDWTPLYCAYRSQNNDMIIALLNAGANPNFNLRGYPFLFLPILNNNTEIVKSLIRANVNVNSYNFKGLSPLFYAIEISDEIAQLLIDAGANVKDASYLHRAIYFNQYGSVSALIQAGADINRMHRSRFGNMTPLDQAIIFNTNNEIVEALMAAGATANLPALINLLLEDKMDFFKGPQLRGNQLQLLLTLLGAMSSEQLIQMEDNPGFQRSIKMFHQLKHDIRIRLVSFIVNTHLAALRQSKPLPYLPPEILSIIASDACLYPEEYHSSQIKQDVDWAFNIANGFLQSRIKRDRTDIQSDIVGSSSDTNKRRRNALTYLPLGRTRVYYPRAAKHELENKRTYNEKNLKRQRT